MNNRVMGDIIPTLLSGLGMATLLSQNIEAVPDIAPVGQVIVAVLTVILPFVYKWRRGAFELEQALDRLDKSEEKIAKLETEKAELVRTINNIKSDASKKDDSHLPKKPRPPFL